MAEREEVFTQVLLSLNRLAAKQLLAGVAGGPQGLETAERLISGALERIGAGWQTGDIALSQVYMSGRICEELMDELLPPGAPQRNDDSAMAIAVLEDYHLLGKRIVYSVLRAGGFALKDYGRVTVDEVVRRAVDDRLRILLLSTLMLPSALRVRDVVRTLKAANPDVKVVVGGAPFLFDRELWREVEADAMGKTAAEAAGIVKRFAGDAR